MRPAKNASGQGRCSRHAVASACFPAMLVNLWVIHEPRSLLLRVILLSSPKVNMWSSAVRPISDASAVANGRSRMVSL